MECEVFTKIINKDTISGILFFVRNEEDNKQLANYGADELYQRAKLCYLAFYEGIDTALALADCEVVINNNIRQFYLDYEDNIFSLYCELDIRDAISIFQMVESFIAQTIISRYEKIIYK